MGIDGSTANGLKPLFSWRSAIADSDLPPTTRHVALALSLYMSERGDSAFPGAGRLTRDTGLSERAIRDHLGRLERAGWLLCIERGGRKGETKRANAYIANVPDPELFPNPCTTITGEPGSPVTLTARTPAGGSPQLSMNSPSKDPSANAQCADEWDAWWDGWPKKVDKARAAAEYRARIRQGIPHEQLVTARDNYVRSKAGDLEHMKYPATFLHGRDGPWSEFLDGIPAAARAPNGDRGPTPQGPAYQEWIPDGR